MGVTNPGRALGRFLLLSTSPKLSTLSGIPPLSTKLFRLASFLALFVGLNLFFLTGALAWFLQNYKSRSVRVRRGVYQGSVLGHVLFFLSLMICLLLCLLPSAPSASVSFRQPSAVLVMLTMWPFGPPPPTAVEATQGLIQLERWSEYWCLLVNPRKCEAAFFSVDLYQANLQPHVLSFYSRLGFNPILIFLGQLRPLSFLF